MAASTIPVRPPTTTPPPVSSPTGSPDSPRLYGPPGWTVRIGLWHLLEPWLDAPRCLPGETPLRTDALGAPMSDYVPFRGMDAATAADLLLRLPAPALVDRQNLSPSLRTMLTACAHADSRACQCSALWERVRDRYELDAHSVPDDIVRTRPEWAGGGVGWWMWWD